MPTDGQNLDIVRNVRQMHALAVPKSNIIVITP